jgi:hypothetical protein
MNDLLHFSGRVELQAAADESKPVKIVIRAYSGGPMNVSGFGPVVVDLAGLDIGRPIPLLAEHESSIDGLLGTGTASTDGRTLTVGGVLSRANERTRQIVAMHKDGVAFSASIGAQPIEREHIPEGSTVQVNSQNIKAGRGGFTLIRSAVLKETSIVAVAADADSAVAIAASKGKDSMNTETNIDTYVVGADQAATLHANFHAALPDPALEQRRLQLIDCWTPRLAPSAPEELRARAADLKARGIAGQLSLDQFRAEAVEIIRAERPKGPEIHASSNDTSNDVLTAAFCRTAGMPEIEKQFDEKTLQASDKFRGLGLQELILKAAFQSGYSGRQKVTDGNLREVLKAAFSTHSLTTILSDSANKILLSGFNAIPQTWREVAEIRNVNDFKQVTAYRMTADLEYEEVGPGGSIHHGTLGQESYTLQAKTYARMLSLTRQDIINDDLGALNDVRNRLGMGAALKMNKLFWSMWLAAANAGTFWTGARGNLVTSAALGEAGLNSATKAFGELVGPDGNNLGIPPDRILVPPALGATGKKIYASSEVRDTTASTLTMVANIYYNQYRPVVVPELGNASYTGNSDTNWWLLAPPAVLASAVMCFLNGQQSPTIESADADFDTLGIQARGYHDFGCSMSEYRASVEAQQ